MIDLSDAYCHVPVKERHQRFLAFIQRGHLQLDMPTVRTGLGTASFCAANELGSSSITQLGSTSTSLLGRLSHSGSLSSPTTGRQMVSPLTSTASRHPELRFICSSTRKITPPPVTISRKKVTSEQEPSEKTNSNSRPDGSKLVGSTPKGWQILRPTTEHCGPIHRRLRLGSGGDYRILPSPTTQVDRSTANVAHQSQRALCYQMGHRIKSTLVSEQIHNSTNRQHSGSEPDPERRRPPLFHLTQGNGQTSTSSSLPSVGLKTYPSTRNVQHSSRQALSKPEPPGVASYSGGNYSNLQEVGNSRGGPICLSPISRSAELRDSRSARSTSPVHGRVLKTLEIQPRLGLHSACTHPNGSTTPRDSNGYNYPSDSSMGPHVLATRCESQSCRRTNQAEQAGPDSSGLDNRPTTARHSESQTRGLGTTG
uniref:Uncharacterized protein n=1 Tax=Cacopsylla melanoneura TaxID=428564 RepID=A0A8D9EG53_9HEMI